MHKQVVVKVSYTFTHLKGLDWFLVTAVQNTLSDCHKVEKKSFVMLHLDELLLLFTTITSVLHEILHYAQ